MSSRIPEQVARVEASVRNAIGNAYRAGAIRGVSVGVAGALVLKPALENLTAYMQSKPLPNSWYEFLGYAAGGAISVYMMHKVTRPMLQ